MDKYEQLSLKLEKASLILKDLKSNDPYTCKFLDSFRQYLGEIRNKAINKDLADTNGASIGLLRWLSDYKELESNEELWLTIADIEKFHQHNF